MAIEYPNVMDHDDDYTVIKFANEERDYSFALSVMKPCCEKCDKRMRDGLRKGWYTLIDVVPHGHDDEFDLLKVYRLTQEGIALHKKISAN